MVEIGNDPGATTIEVADDHLAVRSQGVLRRFHHVWLRDNCPCGDCRVEATGERRLFTADIDEAIAPSAVRTTAGGDLDIEWNDGHRSEFAAAWLARHDYSAPGHGSGDGRDAREMPILWDAGRMPEPPRFDHDRILGSDAEQLAYLDALRLFGAAVVSGVPSVPGQAEVFAEAIGHVREVAFERVHNVFHDPEGYNVAHTPVELKPHTDMPSYHWPPNVQLLHFLVNQADGGETVLVDGWRVLADLRREDPASFELLVRVPVSYQLFSETEDTLARAPMIQLGPEGEVTCFRFSNQLALPLDAPFETVGPFYRAYRRLGRMIDDERYRVVFKARDGDLVTVHGHRVLHGRLAFDPASGARHLQDVYMEWDDLMARRRVLRGGHKPMLAGPVVAAS
jgi:gamma-butyrobetaine dioxygenase